MGRPAKHDRAMSNAERQAAWKARQREVPPLRRLILDAVPNAPTDCPFGYTADEKIRISKVQRMIAELQAETSSLHADIMDRIDRVDPVNPTQERVRDAFRTKTFRVTLSAF